MQEKHADLRQNYEDMTTDALLELHAASKLSDEAYEVLEAILKRRAVTVPDRAGKHHEVKARKSTRSWAVRFAVIGLIVPLVCLAMDFASGTILKICELCWPSGFMLMLAEGHFDLAIYSVSIAVNMLLWAGLGWLIGYGRSSRKR